jgi:hypothetical protein
VARQVARVFERAERSGLGARNWSDVVELMEQEAGLALELPPAREDG